MNKINLIIFSRKRACQLHFLLSSIEQFCTNIFDINIILKTDSDYIDSYNIVKKDFNINFLEESNFQQDILSLIKNETSCFMTDDCVFFRKPEQIPTIKDNSVFSFRYSPFTTLQNHITNEYQPSLNLYTDHDYYIEWMCQNYQYPLNYAYPIALDGHVFTSKKLRDLCERVQFNNSNELEGRLQVFCREVPLIKSHKLSSLVCIPCNNLSNYTKSGHFHSYTVEHLNELFMSGKRINIKKTFENVNVIGSHQEVQLVIE